MWLYYRAAFLIPGLLLVNLHVAVRQSEFAAASFTHSHSGRVEHEAFSRRFYDCA
jgi:hypothetical protein